MIIALRERLEREERRLTEADIIVEEAMNVIRQGASLPVYDPRTPEEIIGYDENGLPR